MLKNMGPKPSKNVTVPAWLNTFGENRQVNFSQMLTDALFQLYQQTNG